MAVRHYDIPNQARFLTYSCYRRRPLLSKDEIRDDYLEHIDHTRRRLGFLLFAWVIMPDHVHLIVMPDNGVIAPVLRGLKQQFAKTTLATWGKTGNPELELARTPRGALRFWQRGGGYDRNIRSEEEFREKVDYIHMNPVRRGLVERPTDWRWSSAAAWAGLDSPLRPDHLP